MLTFNVGPSKISNKVKQDIKKAVDLNILEISHRSREFTEISKKAVLGLKKLFKIPKNYQIIFTASATESMQLSIQNCCSDSSFHFVNGNFSRLFLKISEANRNKVFSDEIEYGLLNDFKKTNIKNSADFVSITHNETSTGVMCDFKDIEFIRKKYPKKILAVDITSSAGAIDFDFEQADLWIFSVQKCLGLPSGLGVLTVSPEALKKSDRLTKLGKNKAGLFTLENLLAKMPEKFQTLSTPNILDIYLLSENIERTIKNGGIQKIILDSQRKELILENFIEKNDLLSHFVKNPNHRSKTIFCLEAKPKIIEKIHKEAPGNNLTIGKGYGDLKSKTIRLANFPSLSVDDYKILIKFLEKTLQSL